MTKIISMIILVGFSLCSLWSFVDAREAVVDPVKNAKIQRLSNLSAEDVFHNLKGGDFVYDDEFLKQGIDRAFKNRKEKGIRFAIIYIQTSKKTKDIGEAKNFHVAKKILQAFPEESKEYLAQLYNSGDPIIRRNVVRVVGGMPNSDFARSILKEALEDKSVCEDNTPESLGDPLRLCDVAYNQIVLCFEIQNVLRTIGTVHKIEIRDYHIDKLKGIF